MTAEPTTKLEHYERRVGRWSRRIAPRFLEWLGREAGGRWLDVGCGGGALGQAILERAPAQVASVDEWEDAIVTLFSAREGPCVVGSTEALPFESARFDTVVSALMLNAMDDPLRRRTGDAARRGTGWRRRRLCLGLRGEDGGDARVLGCRDLTGRRRS